MNELTRKLAIDVLDKTMRHPLARSYFKPITHPDHPEMGDVSLEIAKNKLYSNYYCNVQDWADDIERVWACAEANKQPKAMIASDEMRKIFDKEKKRIDYLAVSNWGKEVCRLRAHISDLMSVPPPKVKQYAAALGNSRLAKPAISYLTEHELQCFVQASERLQSDEENHEMMKIIQELQPEMLNGMSDLWLDVTKLNIQTIQAVRSYIKTTLEKRGEKYPE